MDFVNNIFGRTAMSTSDIPQGYIGLVKYAEGIFTADKSAKLTGVVETVKGEIIGFIDMTDDSARDSDRIAEENRFLQSIAESGETVIIRGLFMWKSGDMDIPSANFRKGLEELDPANIEAEFLLRGGNGFLPRKLGAMRPGN